MQILVRLVTEDDDTEDEPSAGEATLYVHVRSAGRAPDTTRLLVDVDGNAKTYRLWPFPGRPLPVQPELTVLPAEVLAGHQSQVERLQSTSTLRKGYMGMDIAFPMVRCRRCRKLPGMQRSMVYRPAGSGLTEWERPDPDRQPSPLDECRPCRGFGVIGNFGGVFSSGSAAERAREYGQVNSCFACKGSGKVRGLPVLVDCPDCDGTGFEELRWVNEAHVVPEAFGDLTRFPGRAWIQGWAAATRVVVIDRRGAPVGSGLKYRHDLYGVLDYGSRSTMPEMDYAANILAKLPTEYIQLCKVADETSRRVSRTLLVDRAEFGFTVVSESQIRS